MPRAKKSWTEKLHDAKDLPKVEVITDAMSARWGSGTCVIPAPIEVDEVMRRVPHGRLITINEIRAFLARKHRADIACPMTTGIFAWIAAHAAQESIDEGRNNATPYWRTLKSGGEVNPKFPGGVERLRDLLVSEGHQVVPRGRRILVIDFEKSLFDPESRALKRTRAAR